MAARISGQFFSAYTNSSWSVVLYDTEYVGDPYAATIVDAQLNYPPGNEGRFDPIIPAELTVRLLVNNSTLDAFVEDLAGASEGRFMLQLVQGITNEFIGYVLPDLAQQEDTTIEAGYVFDLKATDSLGRLKTIPYNNAGINYTGEATFIEHIFNCLNKLPEILEYYGGSNWLLRTVVNWHAQQYTYAGTIDPLLRSRTPHRAFYQVDRRGAFVYKSCFDVLTEICKAWGARMFYSDYAFWIVQVNELATPSAKTVFSYTKTQTQSSQTVDFRKDHDQEDAASDLLRLSGGIFRFYPPLQKVQVDYQHIATRNLLAGQSAPFDSPPYNAGPVDSQAASGNMIISFTMRARIESRLDPPGDVPIWLLFGVRVQVGDDYYLHRNATISGGGVTYDGATWLNSFGLYEIAFLIPDGEYDHYFDVQFYTGSIIESGDFRFDVVLLSQHLLDGTEIVTAGGAGTVVWLADTLSAVHLFNGTLGQQADIRRFVATNDTADNSAMQEITTILGDGIGTNSPGHIKVENDSSEWVLSDGWRVGNSGSYRAFGSQLTAEIIRGQLTPVRRFFGRYHNRNSSIYKAFNVINRSDGVMVFAGGTFRPALDEVDGEWFFITPETTGWTDEPYEDILPDPSGAGLPPTGGGGGGGGSPGGSISQPLRMFSQEFATVTANTVTITVNSGVLPTNASQILVFWNGQYITSDFYTVTGSDIAFTFDVEDNVTVKFFIQ